MAPWTIAPLLILGGTYLCFEGAEKIWHTFMHHAEPGPQQAKSLDAAHLEEKRVAGAIKTDFILSAEIMTIALATIDSDTIWTRVIVLGLVAVAMTVLVYGAVAVLVKLDDLGLRLSKRGSLETTRWLGSRLVVAMPTVFTVISAIGTAAMLWVGGSIIVHGLNELHVSLPYETIKGIAKAVSGGATSGVFNWMITAFLDAVIGFILGTIVMPVVAGLLAPLGALFPEKQ